MLDVKLDSDPPVSITFTPVIANIVTVVDGVLHEHDLHATITCGDEGKHAIGSQHYYNRAVDFRTSDWPFDSKPKILGQIIARLGKSFFVLMESDHLHVELRERP